MKVVGDPEKGALSSKNMKRLPNGWQMMVGERESCSRADHQHMLAEELYSIGAKELCLVEAWSNVVAGMPLSECPLVGNYSSCSPPCHARQLDSALGLPASLSGLHYWTPWLTKSPPF